jgi:hypothetical protein
MSEDPSRTIEKALSLNLDPLKYGTIVEIGAGQEVARWFFQAGAAAGTIAKTMSAYDMQISDQIYGVSADQRYVSRARLKSMLDHEFDLLTSRIGDHRPADSRFFAFANTVAAQGFNKRSDCHGWLGIRLQMTPQAEPDDIILHVQMLDETNLDQQEALGIFGVNLVYGAYHHLDDPKRFLKGLMDSLRWGRIEVDMIEMRGPNLGPFDDRLMALELVKEGLTRAVLFDPDGNVVIPAEGFYKRRVLAMRGKFHTIHQSDIDMFAHARHRFQEDYGKAAREDLCVTELTMAQFADDRKVDTGDFLARTDRLAAAGFFVLVSDFFRFFRVRQYFASYSKEAAAIVVDIEGLGHIFYESYYNGLKGGLLEGIGQLLPEATVIYVYPPYGTPSDFTLDDLPVEDNLRPLLEYLHSRGQIRLVDDYTATPI